MHSLLLILTWVFGAGQLAVALPNFGASPYHRSSFYMNQTLPKSPAPYHPSSTIPSSSTSASPPVVTDSCDYVEEVAGKDLYRAFNPTTVDYMYTTNAAELAAASSQGYYSQGVVARIYGSGPPGTFPIYRLFSTAATDHLYTMNVTERDQAVSQRGYTSDGIAGYAYTLSICRTVPFYQFYNVANQNHFYTIDLVEAAAFERDGYVLQNITGYVIHPH